MPIRQAIKLDGSFNDWRDAQPLVRHYDDRYRIDDPNAPFTQSSSLSFDHAVGRYQQYVYAMFAVKDNVWIKRPPNARGVEQNDHLLIAMSDDNDVIQRFVITPRGPGWVNGSQSASDANSYEVVGNEPRITGHGV